MCASEPFPLHNLIVSLSSCKGIGDPGLDRRVSIGVERQKNYQQIAMRPHPEDRNRVLHISEVPVASDAFIPKMDV